MGAIYLMVIMTGKVYCHHELQETAASIVHVYLPYMTQLLNISIRIAHFPKCWKQSNTYHRPISLLQSVIIMIARCWNIITIA